MTEDAFDGAVATHNVAVRCGHQNADGKAVEDALQGLTFHTQLIKGLIADAEGVTDLILLLPGPKRGANGGEQRLRAYRPLEQDGFAEGETSFLQLTAAKAFTAAGGEQDDGEVGPGLLAREKNAEMFDESRAEGFLGEHEGPDGAGA